MSILPIPPENQSHSLCTLQMDRSKSLCLGLLASGNSQPAQGFPCTQSSPIVNTLQERLSFPLHFMALLGNIKGMCSLPCRAPCQDVCKGSQDTQNCHTTVRSHVTW